MNEFFPEGALIHTAQNRKLLSDLAGMEKAKNEEIVLEARASLCDQDLNLIFHLGGYRAILPKKEAVLAEQGGEIRDIAVISRVGKPSAFLIDRIEYEPEPVIFLSRKKAQEKCLREKLDLLEEGDVLEARITHFEPFGAFCDIGCGITSLLSIDCISISRIWHPSDRFSLGERIYCAVKARDEVLLGRRGRISLTHKELLGTWEENAALFHVGETTCGIVRSVEKYGVFIELMPNLAGLAELRQPVRPGQRTSVYIKALIPEKLKVKLILVDVCEDVATPDPIRYFYNDSHIDRWVYTPENSGKHIETVFDGTM